MAISEYTQLEYIESTGTQYIDTLQKGNSNTKIELKFYNSYTSSSEKAVFGSRTYPRSNCLMIGFYNNGWVCYNNEEGAFANILNKVTDLKLVKNNMYVLNSSTQQYELVKTYNSGSFTTPSNMILFGERRDNDVTQLSSIKVYHCKIYDEDVLVRDLIPVRKNEDNEICMYDKVTKQYFTNQGTGNFIAGPVVYDGSQLQQNILEIQDLMTECNELGLLILGEHTPPPTGYTKLEYIESSRTQFIDTGVSTGVNVGFEIDFQVMDTRREDAYFGARNSGVSPSRYGCLNYNGGFHMMLSGNSIWNYTVDTTRHKCSIMFNENSYTAKFDNNTSTGTLNATNSGNFGLFGYEFPSRDEHPRSAMRLYSAKLYTNNITLVRDLIPVKRNEDNVICLYDKVSNTYFINSGIGSFTAGPEIN